MKKYIYIDREEARKGSVLVFSVSHSKIDNYDVYFEGDAIEFYGEDIPHHITYEEESDTIRKANDYELYERGVLSLKDGQAIINKQVVSFDSNTHVVKNGTIVEKSREDYILDGDITIESQKHDARFDRANLFKAMDIYDKNILCGRKKSTEKEQNEVTNWYNKWLNVPNNYKDLNIDIVETYPKTPSIIEYYLKK